MKGNDGMPVRVFPRASTPMDTWDKSGLIPAWWPGSDMNGGSAVHGLVLESNERIEEQVD